MLSTDVVGGEDTKEQRPQACSIVEAAGEEGNCFRHVKSRITRKEPRPQTA